MAYAMGTMDMASIETYSTEKMMFKLVQSIVRLSLSVYLLISTSNSNIEYIVVSLQEHIRRQQMKRKTYTNLSF